MRRAVSYCCRGLGLNAPHSAPRTIPSLSTAVALGCSFPSAAVPQVIPSRTTMSLGDEIVRHVATFEVRQAKPKTAAKPEVKEVRAPKPKRVAKRNVKKLRVKKPKRLAKRSVKKLRVKKPKRLAKRSVKKLRVKKPKRASKK